MPSPTLSEVTPREYKRLFEGMIAWCDPAAINAVRAAERRLTAHQMGHAMRPRISPLEELRPSQDGDWMAGGPDYGPLIEAWNVMKNDFRRCIESELLFLEGVHLSSVRRSEPEEIPSAWAAEMEFDFERNALSISGSKYAAVKVFTTPRPVDAALHKEPMPAPSQALGAPRFPVDAQGRFILAAHDVGKLADDTVIALLEEHARRVVEEHGAPLLPPGKISLLPLVLRKLEHRGEVGELMPKVSAEATWLEGWIAEAAPSHSTPSQSTIESAIRVRYAQLKARSNGRI